MKVSILILRNKRKGTKWLPFLFVFISIYSYAQMSISGKSGLLYTPDAKEVKDGTLSIGYMNNPVNYALRIKNINSEDVLFANLVVLPRLDISLSFLRLRSSSQRKIKQGLGDRQLDFRYLILKEKKNFPSVALALSTPFTIDAALLTHVVVATKQFKLNSKFGFEGTLGYGSPYFLYRAEDNLTNSNIFSNLKWQKKSEYRYNNGYLTGPFGGIKLNYQNRAGVMAEWDSQKLNIGVYGTLWRRWTIQAGLLNFDQVTFGSSFAVDLFKPTTKVRKLYE